MSYRALISLAAAPSLLPARQPASRRALAGFGLGGSRRAYSGLDYVEGIADINLIPSRCFVALYDQDTRLLLAQQWTGADGYFRFTRVDANRKCFVVAFDLVTGEQAVIFDRI